MKASTKVFWTGAAVGAVLGAAPFLPVARAALAWWSTMGAAKKAIRARVNKQLENVSKAAEG